MTIRWLLLAVSALLAPSVADAQSNPDAPVAGGGAATAAVAAPMANADARWPLPPPQPSLRLRAGIGYEAGGMSVGPSFGLGLLGAYGILGAQFGDRLSVAATASLGFSIVSGYFRAGLRAELHATDWLSFSAGADYAAFGSFLLVSASAGQGLAMPFGLHFSLGGRTESNMRKGLQISLLGDVLYSFSAQGGWSPTATNPGMTSSSAGWFWGSGGRIQIGTGWY
jgi:hypothetical protein